MTSTSEKEKAKEKEVEKVVPDNTKLYRRTQTLFKKRREALKASKNKPKELPVLNQEVPKFGFHPHRPPYRRPWSGVYEKLSLPDVPSRPSNSKPIIRRFRKEKPKVKEPEEPKPKLNILAKWPPPPDSNYFQGAFSAPVKTDHHIDYRIDDSPSHPPIQTFAPKLKFVDCDLCGKKNFSSSNQLKAHQASKKCKNRRKGLGSFYCQVCDKKFDNDSNYSHHICRLK